MLLVRKNYDPAGALVTKSLAAAAAMAAVDTTNLRNTFTVPSNGIVMVRQQTMMTGTTDQAGILLGCLESTTVRGRQVPNMVGRPSGSASGKIGCEVLYPITGLTPSASVSLDAAYGIEGALASCVLGYGGPNDTTTVNAHGAYVFEVWEANNLLAATMYDPGTVANFATSALTAMTALDTTNLRLTFTTAASGAGSTAVYVRIRGGSYNGATGTPGVLWGVLGNLAGGTGTTVLGRVPSVTGQLFNGTASTTMMRPVNASFCVTGLTASTSYSFDLAMGVDFVVASSNFSIGGPNDTTATNAWGGIAFEVWKA